MSALANIWVAGEALIDLISSENGESALVGGGPANTARSLARLEISTSFIGGISTDSYGESVAAELATSGVNLDLALRSQLRTATARVDLTGQVPRYEFDLEETATFAFESNWLPLGSPTALHLGSLAALISPGRDALFEWASAITAPIIFDPNVRPSVLPDAKAYRAAVLPWFTIAEIVKLSEEDLDYLYRDETSSIDEESIIQEILNLGPNLIVLTRAARGLSAFTRSGVISVPGVPIDVVDTVGAGDTVGAVLLEAIARFGYHNLFGERLFETLKRAAQAAALTCARAGARPPSAAELN